MFEKNILTFNPGWDQNSQTLESFDDVGEISNSLKADGVKLISESIEGTSGPGNITLIDPDGNPVLIDQHVKDAYKVPPSHNRDGMLLRERASLNPSGVLIGWGLSDGVARVACNPILEICNAFSVEFSVSNRKSYFYQVECIRQRCKSNSQ